MCEYSFTARRRRPPISESHPALIMNLLDPFFLFIGIEIVAFLMLLVVALRGDVSMSFVALHGYATPEVVALLFAPAETLPLAPQEPLVAEGTPVIEAPHGEDAWASMLLAGLAFHP
ncbi:hypothetical protein BG61_27230 [Caballeronia glathei]|uniref:Uncharacterized protein n=2 Tax=Caballeronia glathei TaxID=60547 RepID=A0A069PIL1_9BURK|nr:hypothetical protein BG61_27230 [Caballeronia glathei]TCK34966.1 hypothetical protein B0G84_6931 [Paraburkholderia sp. BL8N3]